MESMPWFWCQNPCRGRLKNALGRAKYNAQKDRRLSEGLKAKMTRCNKESFPENKRVLSGLKKYMILPKEPLNISQ